MYYILDKAYSISYNIWYVIDSGPTWGSDPESFAEEESDRFQAPKLRKGFRAYPRGAYTNQQSLIGSPKSLIGP